MSEVTQKIQAILHETFEIPMDKLKQENLPFQDLGLDSLDLADLIVNLEKDTNTKYGLDEFRDIKTVGDLYSLVGRLVQ